MNQWHLRGVGGDYDYEIIIVKYGIYVHELFVTFWHYWSHIEDNNNYENNLQRVLHVINF
jgi:hypothetical protein